MSSRLKEKYESSVAQLSKDFGGGNIMATPKVTKVVVNMGVGEAAKNKEALQSLKQDFATITGQAPAITQARVSIASFNLRRGMPVGLKVTLRGVRMYDFLDRLFSIVLPRLRDFRGVGLKGFDRQGNYTLGLVEHTVFPEIAGGKVTTPHGMEITIVTNTKNLAASKKLLEILGMPFEKEDQN